MQLGIQLWQILSDNRADTELFRKLSSFGYTFVEPCILFGTPIPSLPALLTPGRYEEMLPLLQEAGLQVKSFHIFLQSGTEDYERVAEFARKHHARAMVVKCPAPLTRESLEKAAKDYDKLAGMLEKKGTALLLHPEAADVVQKIDGMSAYEWLLLNCPKLKIQADVGYLYFGDPDLREFIKKYRDRVRSLHYKDVMETAEESNDGSFRGVSIGSGKLHLFTAFEFAREMEIPQIVDSDSVGIPSLQEAEQAAGRILSFASVRGEERSVLETYDIVSGKRERLHVFDRVIEAPNWLKDGDSIVYNSEGRLYRYSISKDSEELLDTGSCISLNNDHVPSPDEKSIGVSDMKFENGSLTSHVYAVPLRDPDGQCIRMTSGEIDFLHGWSPDGKEIAWCAFRPADPSKMTPSGRKADGMSASIDVDIYTKVLPDGEEKRLTDGRGYSDGPEYDPDNETIWFQSTMDGLMQIYRIGRDGNYLRQVIKTGRNDWFPHVSPDGRKVVYISFGAEEILPSEHIPGMHVKIFLMDSDGSGCHEILRLYGGQGSMNVNSWAPDSRRFAFVSYEKKA